MNPFFHAFGYKAGWLASLLTGATVYPHAVFDAEAVLARVPRDRISMLPGPPALFQTVLARADLDTFDLSSLRLAVTGAAAIPVSLVEAMRDRLGFETVITGYGLTEACGIATMCRHDDDPHTIATTSGRAIPGIEVLAVDDAGKEVPRGEPGEIVVRGYNVMLGYFDQPEETAEAIDADGWLHTGDIGVMDERGYIAITDRKKDMFIVGGFNAYPAEIESLMSRHPAIAQSAVIGVPDDRLGEVGWAYVILRADVPDVTEGELIAWCKEQMANYKVPRRVLFVDALPLNATGKVLKYELREQATARVDSALAATSVTAPTDSVPNRTTDDAVAGALAALDAVVAAKAGGEQREGQHEMCAAVARALATGEHLLVEAPTGIGKSLAYGVAAVLHVRAAADARAAAPAAEGDEDEHPRAVIATATKALQEQLCDEDLPVLADIFAARGASFTFALLKGRSNYVCPAKLDELAAGEEPEGLFAPTTREVARGEAIARVTEWAATTDTGDRAELDEDVPDDVWQALSTTARDCPGVNNCPAGPRCLAEKARTRARDADVVVVNTSLYAAHLVAGGHVLPTHDTVILDEAHLLEDIVADAFGADVHGGRLRALAVEVAHFGGPADLVNRLRSHAQRLDLLLEQLAGVRDPRVRACEGELAEVLAAVRASVVESVSALRDAVRARAKTATR